MMDSLPVTVNQQYLADPVYLGQAPTVHGMIKSTPQDFLVVEQLAEEPTGEGEHVYIQLTKENANTHWVAFQIAQFAGLRDLDVSYAGRKDRHAVTQQWFSCYMPRDLGIDWSKLDIEGVKVDTITRHRCKLRRGEIAANRFKITVRHQRLDDLSSLTERLEQLRDVGFPNYFGSQRFGHMGENLRLADELLRQGKRIKKHRDIYLSAARSWLFNGYLSGQLHAGIKPSVDQSLLGPLYGKSRDPQPGEEFHTELEKSWVAGLRRFGLKVGQRELFVRPADLSWQNRDDCTELECSLPAGSFATVMLREIFIVEDASQQITS